MNVSRIRGRAGLSWGLVVNEEAKFTFPSLLLFLEWVTARSALPVSSCSLTQRAPLGPHVSQFPPLQIYSLNVGVSNMWRSAGAHRPDSLQRHMLFRSELKLVSVLRKWNLNSCWHREVKWRREQFSWTGRLCVVPSVWIYWRIRWLLPVDTVTAWTVSKTTGTQRMRRKPTAALSVRRASHRGLSWWKVPC